MWRFIYKSILMVLALAIAIVPANLLIFSLPNDAYLSFEEYGVRSSIALMAQEAGKYDTLFVGDSRIKRSLIPAEFDAIAGTHSLNVAVPGLMFPRTNEYLRYILEHHDDGLKHVFIGFTDFYRKGSNFGSDPVLYTVSPDALLTAAHIRGLERADPIIVNGMFKETLRAVAYKYFGLGTDRYIEKSMFEERFDPAAFTDALYKKYAGFIPFDEQIADLMQNDPASVRDMEDRRAQFVRNYEADHAMFLNGATWLSRLDFSEAPLFPETVETLRLAQQFEEKGIAVYFIVPPRSASGTLFPAYSQMGHYADYEVFSFIDPEQYPAFYTFENAFDTGHLNTAGARIFSRVLAEEFARRQN